MTGAGTPYNFRSSELVEGPSFRFQPEDSMTFWTYMLHCADRSFNVAIPTISSEESPPTNMERRIKGWSRGKKLALIRADWEGIAILAKSRQS